MTIIRRRLMLGIGAALLVGGWGATRFAHEQQQSFSADGWRQHVWTTKTHIRLVGPSQVIYGAGVISMALGAGLIGFAVLRPTNRN